MKRTTIFLFLVILLVVPELWFISCREKNKTIAKEEAVFSKTSKRSDVFNHSIQNIMDAYYQMTEGFVNWDTATIATHSAKLKTALERLSMDELKNDSLLYQKAIAGIAHIKSEVDGLIQDHSIDGKRASLNILSQLLFDYLNIIRYDAATIYFQECPMAFNDTNPGNWLSSTEAVR